MKLFVPDYYDAFACKMGACRHTCCAGWEIDVDEDALAMYETVGGTLGDKLRASIDGENGCFRLGEGERCPFLRDDGLCELIAELGEEALCQICRDHPRYYNDYSDRSEAGLGLCCEAAAELVLTRREKIGLVEWDDDGGEERADPEEEALRAWRQKVLDIVQDRTRTLEKRLAAVRALTGTPRADEAWNRLLLSLERLDDSWSERLRNLKTDIAPLAEEWALPMEQFWAYLIYRHLTMEKDALLTVGFTVLAVETVMRMLAEERERSMDALCEICRQFSAEIEYSDENISAILDFLARRAEE